MLRPFFIGKTVLATDLATGFEAVRGGGFKEHRGTGFDVLGCIDMIAVLLLAWVKKYWQNR